MRQNDGLLYASTLLALSISTLSAPAAGQTFSTGELSGYLNLEMSYGLRVRMEDFDPSIIGPTNIEGGSFHLNADDGNLNYEQHDVVANVFSIKPELAMKWRNFGFFASGYAFYDFENSDGSRPHVPLSDETKRDVAHDADFREAYVSVRFLANDMPTRLRVGKQVLNWGQANFFQGIKSLNPVNILHFAWLMVFLLLAALLGDLVLLPAILAGPLGRFFESGFLGTFDKMPIPEEEVAVAEGKHHESPR